MTAFVCTEKTYFMRSSKSKAREIIIFEYLLQSNCVNLRNTPQDRENVDDHVKNENLRKNTILILNI